MSPKLFVLTIALALAAGFAGHAFAGRLFAAAGTEAHAGAPRYEDGNWEYCAVTKANFPGSVRAGQYWINYFRGPKVETVTVAAGISESGLAKAVSRLGEEGWEMVGEGSIDTGPNRADTISALYFKRRR